MQIIDLDSVLLVSLWTLSVEEVISNNYNFSEGINKIALSLANQKLTKEESSLLEAHNWLVIEVEPSLQNASSEDLENYLKSYFHDIVRDIKESAIIYPESEQVIKSKKTR